MRVGNVLVYPCETALGMELYASIRSCVDFRLFGCPGDPLRGGYVYREVVDSLPAPEEDGFLSALTPLLREHRIDFIYPASDRAMLELSELAADGLVEAEVIAPGPEVCRACLSRAAMHARFSGKIALPRMFHTGSAAPGEYPLWREGGRVDGPDGLSAAGDGPLFEYLPGREYTVDCFTGGSGELAFVSGRERRAGERGGGSNFVLCDSPAFRRFAEAINAGLALRGAWAFLLREDGDGRPRLIGVRPRLDASSGLQRARGANLALASLRDRMGCETGLIVHNLPGAGADRREVGFYRLPLRYDTVYIGLANTVVTGGLVNPDAVRFICQCRNRGVRVVLVERGAEPPEKTLARHRLEGLFDQLLWIGGTESKATVMTDRRAIFIDADASERREAARGLGIPVFEPSALEVLME